MEYISKTRAIQAIADCTTYGDKEKIDEICRKSVTEANDWIGGIRDAISAVEDVQAEVWPLCQEAREVTEDDFAGADNNGVIPAWVESPETEQMKGQSGWTLITKINLMDMDKLYFTCRPTIDLLNKALRR